MGSSVPDSYKPHGVEIGIVTHTRWIRTTGGSHPDGADAMEVTGVRAAVVERGAGA